MTWRLPAAAAVAAATWAQTTQAARSRIIPALRGRFRPRHRPRRIGRIGKFGCSLEKFAPSSTPSAQMMHGIARG
jgi:hypothetical protein